MSVGGDADLPEHGFDFWREMLAQQVMPVLVRTRDAAAFARHACGPPASARSGRCSP
jgi:hypothetical protein